MASIFNLHTLCSPVCYSSKSFSYKPQTPAFKSQSQCEWLFKPKKRSMILTVQTRNCRSQIYAAQSNFFRVLQTAYKVGKDGIEAGATLVPESIPRPVARITVAVVGASVVLFLLKSILSTAFFFLATMGLIYSAFIAFNKDDGPAAAGDGGTTTTTTTEEETLEEARRIMEKYK
ncbi:hypothetical protein E3N88_44334 [Mikania micrantha]|uniref:Uncharacterized protein n=1 Tax=Mikania micrantha TaxID=192012 RepID=A0A5N6LCA9_9ASTR|nr:hypothetical protein E3N88_44334 [Mikania micrantha]